MLGQIDGNHTSSQLALSHGGEGEERTGRAKEGVCVGRRRRRWQQAWRGRYAGPPWEQKNA